MRRVGIRSAALLALIGIAGCGKENAPPIASPQLVELLEDMIATGELHATDPEGSRLSFEVESPPTHGSLTLERTTGRFTYQPDPDFHGSDSFRYFVSDGKNVSRSTTVTLSIAPVNDAPVALPLAASTFQGAPLVERLSADDVEGDSLTFMLSTPPRNGTLVLDDFSGTIVYAPDPDFHGTDTFTYQVSDGSLNSAPADVTLNIARVEAVRDAPLIAAGSKALIDVAANDIGVNPAASIELVGQPLTGKAWLEDFAIRYEAPPEPGRDMFVYELKVGKHRSVNIVDVSILDPDDPTLHPPPGISVMRQAVPVNASKGSHYVPVNGLREDIQALRPLAEEILEAYGSPASNLDRARALRDWVARTAIHPYPPLHPDGSQANLAVLPTGATWADVNRLYSQKFDSDSAYWRQVHFNGFAMLDRLLGTLDPATGRRASDGLMERVGPAQYRIKDISEYRYVLCSYQNVMLISLWGSIGLQGLLLSTNGHDPAAVFIPEFGRWVYEDATYNEEFTLKNSSYLLSPLDLLALSRAGRKDHIVGRKITGPSWSPDVYVDARINRAGTYFGDGHPYGMSMMGSQLNNDLPTSPTFRVHTVQIQFPDLERPFNDPSLYLPADPAIAFPRPGARIAGIIDDGDQVRVELEPTHPDYITLEKRIGLGPWEPVAPSDTIPKSGTGVRVTYRGVDPVGVPGTGSTMLIGPTDSR